MIQHSASETIGRMRTNIAEIAKGHETIGTLLKACAIAVKNGNNEKDKWQLEALYQKPECSVGIATTQSEDGAEFPQHCHAHSVEYLICIRGDVLFTIPGLVTRVLRPGDCASIPAGMKHSTRPVGKGGAVVYVCVPYDPEMPEQGKKKEKTDHASGTCH